jgi:hypothetical protein
MDPSLLGGRRDPTPVSEQALRTRRAGGADADATDIQLTLVGRSTGTVIVDELRPVVLRRTRPLEGLKVKGPDAFCGPGGVNTFEIDLEAASPRLLNPEYGADAPAKPKDFVWKLAPGEAEIFHLVAFADESSVEWNLELRLIVDGQAHTIALANGGKPFRTSGADKIPQFSWENGAWHVDHPAC